jgi:uncharacterized protein
LPGLPVSGAGLINAILPESGQLRRSRFTIDSSHQLNHYSNVLRIIGISARGKYRRIRKCGQVKGSIRDRGSTMARFEILDSNAAPLGQGPAAGDMLFELGLMYSVGRDMPIDLVAAHKWFNLAAMKGNADAIRLRREIASQMSDVDIAAAQRAARDWLRLNDRESVPAAIAA